MLPLSLHFKLRCCLWPYLEWAQSCLNWEIYRLPSWGYYEKEGNDSGYLANSWHIVCSQSTHVVVIKIMTIISTYPTLVGREKREFGTTGRLLFGWLRRRFELWDLVWLLDLPLESHGSSTFRNLMFFCMLHTLILIVHCSYFPLTLGYV